MDIKFNFINEAYSKEYDIIYNNLTVGKLFLFGSGNVVNIESIHINKFYQRKGIGREVINKLKEEYSIIAGCSSPFAINFWLKVGAEFEYEVNEDMIYELVNMGEYPPFSIY